jgi:molybdenum cofactor cytidylyltransferase
LDIAALILAAGESSRMGRDKALLTYRAHTFLEMIVTTLHEGGIERITAVLGHHAEDIRKTVNLDGVEVVVNARYREGQTSSLQAGLRHLASRQPRAVLLCLVDHPVLRVAVVRTLIESFRQSNAPVVIPTFEGQRGHPVLICSELFRELLGLSPEQGANTVVHKFRDSTHFVPVDDPGILLDIDDPQSYHGLVEGG